MSQVKEEISATRADLCISTACRRVGWGAGSCRRLPSGYSRRRCRGPFWRSSRLARRRRRLPDRPSHGRQARERERRCNSSEAVPAATIRYSPKNDRLVYLTAAEVVEYLDEIAATGLPTRLIAFTGGEPFMNPELPVMLADVLSRGFDTLVLTNAMKPMVECKPALLQLKDRYGDRLTIRVSIDHYSQAVHGKERGRRSWQPTVDGLCWLARNGFSVHVAARRLSGASEAEIRAGFGRLFAKLGVAIDPADPVRLIVFPEMDASVDVPEITEAWWAILGKSPENVMCASSRMVVKRTRAQHPAVLACTLLAYDDRFELGPTLASASGAVPLNHPHCAKFCVLGGGACSRS